MGRTSCKLEKIPCQSCGGLSADVRLGSSYSLGEVMRRSGYEPVFNNDTSIGWLCPSCADRLSLHVRAIVEILRDEDDHVYWGSLRAIAKHRAGVDPAAQSTVGFEVAEERRRMREEVLAHATLKGTTVIMSGEIWETIAAGICPRRAGHSARGVRSREASPSACIAWGTLEEAGHHEGCPAVFESESDRARFPGGPDPASYPVACPCECRDCRRAWWAAGRPVVCEGRVVRSSSWRR